MNKRIILGVLVAMIAIVTFAKGKKVQPELWPDGTPIPAWFSDTSRVDVSTLGKKYVVTNYGVKNYSEQVQTEKLQAVIDLAASQGGGVIVIPRGFVVSGSLFFKKGTHLLIEENGELRGSDRIRDFKLVKTRMEGQTLNYFAALVNADDNDGFTITGPGTINGNGQAYWEEFWIRRQYNKNCTNLEAMRPRNVYISNSKNVTVQDVRIINSPFWTNHLYKCENVRYLGCYIFAPFDNVTPVDPKRGAPSSDAIDIDVCKNVLISGCYMSVNDDAVVLKGGKGTWADKDPNNGPCENIIVTDCTYGKVHGCMTLGSESLHDKNVIMRRCTVKDATRVLWLKMRPDTPQHYEYVRVENFKGNCGSFLVVRPWTQFFKPENREDMPLSQCNNIYFRNINMDCKNFFDVGTSDKYRLKDFTFENINVTDQKKAFNPEIIENCTVKNVQIK
ncbi:glycoside hydrolase family 28 protein [Prevotella sp. E13-27]|uniref:rhamnogalacturonidase n=1 Tax=Prevotella sp. E13-27 TaxID=2938122 RepID=UPI00200AF54D|nr:glycosyl hydrolase family 28 protein [Prevotella sp. E13-27]MCK8622656.1 glycosyl hydrolase family 28 protein [Prevotella sp. E13-27]